MSKRTTGWEAYRHGIPRPKHHLPIFGKDKRMHLINLISEAMSRWRYSPFQYEGVTRAHLRSALCLAGYGWERSDAEATYLIAEMLKGFPRPSWQAGQPSYTASIFTCKGCGGPLDEYEISHGIRFCCDECRRIGQLKTTGLALGFVELGPRECNNPRCRKVFYPKDLFREFCSRSCSIEGRSLNLPVRNCAYCDTPFQPANDQALYCQPLCNNRMKDSRKKAITDAARQPTACEQCGTIFQPKKRGTRFCGDPCSKKAASARYKAAKTDPASPIGKLFDKAA